MVLVGSVMHQGVSGIVLAGGKSRRMGCDKAFLQVGGQPLIQRVVAVLRLVADDLIVVTNSPDLCAGLGTRVVSDLRVGKGALGGLHAGLCAMHHETGLVVACDMPFLNRRLLEHIVSLGRDVDVAIPSLDDHLEPLHAVYSKSCIATIEALLDRGRLSILDLFPLVQVRYIRSDELGRFDPSQRSIVNINTPSDLARARQFASRASAKRPHAPSTPAP